ncbi:MAG: hypothetical protein HYS18_15420 [Burkholderiales bacterium]|nr:hypothetical protein [Burkholderiales bacterium]
MNSVQRFLLSNGNIAGSAAALAVTVSYLAGLIDQGWGLLAVGAYAAGFLPFAFVGKPVHMPEGLSTAEALEWLRTSAMPRLPQNARPILSDIIARVDGLMPRLKEMEEQGIVEASSRALLKQTVVRLLPDAVETYLRLPATYAKVKTLEDGKTPQQLLIDQLAMLQTHVHSLEDNLLSADINSMLANGKFLQEKFQQGIALN